MNDWVEALQSRGIKVTKDILRQEACEVLESYLANEGHIYNGRNSP